MPLTLPQTTLVPLEPPYRDSRGLIQNLVHHDLGSAVMITSEPGSVRAEHWHREDFHYCYLIEGELLYLERPLGSRELPSVVTIRAGELFFTPSRVEHAMYFTMRSVFLTLGKLSRTHASYEADLVRLTDKLTDIPEIRQKYLSGQARA